MTLVKEDAHGRKYFVTCCDSCGKITEGIHTCNPNPVIETLRKQRDELVEVLEIVLSYPEIADYLGHRITTFANAALNKVKGGA